MSAGTGRVVGYISLLKWDELGREEDSYIGVEVRRDDECALQARAPARCASH